MDHICLNLQLSLSYICYVINICDNMISDVQCIYILSDRSVDSVMLASGKNHAETIGRLSPHSMTSSAVNCNQASLVTFEFANFDIIL